MTLPLLVRTIMKREEILNIVEKVHSLQKSRANTLPDHSYFLDDTTILCYPRQYGDSRYPYQCDGLTLYAHTSGYIDCSDGLLNIFRTLEVGEDAPICFFAGEKHAKDFFPISITGAARQLFEPDGVERYLIYTPACAYYITETLDAVYAVRTYVDQDKHLRFSFGAVNLGKRREIYLASYFEPTLRHGAPDIWGFLCMTRYGELLSNGNYVLKSHNASEDCMSVNVSIEGKVIERHATTARRTILGRKGGNLTNALAWKDGCYTESIVKTNSTDIPCASDMVHFEFEENGFVLLDYEILVSDSYETALSFASMREASDSREADLKLFAQMEKEKEKLQSMDIRFEDWHKDTIHCDVLNAFLKCVQKQISICALGKVYAGDMLGIRDVFQQLETALIWQPKEARGQIVRVMNYMLDSGRPPRQITFPTKENPIPKMDLRPFIDQGFWIVTAIHTYLSYTDDVSILEEICGYYKAEGTYGPLSESDEKDSILCHLIRITDFLISNIDERTNCVHMLFGDWNDALDGLGRTQNPDREFGDGVSVMATEQLYLTLAQMMDILDYLGGYEEQIDRYRMISDSIAEGFRKYAVDMRGEDARIMHGWGEMRAYLVGSFQDFDGLERLSLTSNAYFAISGLSSRYPELCEAISNNILSLDSKYGLLTFDKPFEQMEEKIGRIANITPGTYENAAAYLHAGTFGIMALFIMGHAKEAWELIEKIMVISQEKPSRTTFVMPNSYCHVEEYSIYGDSTNDWYTGSGTVLMKDIIKYGFGIQPSLQGLTIAPPEYMPTTKASVRLVVKGAKVNVSYENKGESNRKIYLNGNKLLSDAGRAFIPREEMLSEMDILILD